MQTPFTGAAVRSPAFTVHPMSCHAHNCRRGVCVSQQARTHAAICPGSRLLDVVAHQASMVPCPCCWTGKQAPGGDDEGRSAASAPPQLKRARPLGPTGHYKHDMMFLFSSTRPNLPTTTSTALLPSRAVSASCARDTSGRHLRWCSVQPSGWAAEHQNFRTGNSRDTTSVQPRQNSCIKLSSCPEVLAKCKAPSSCDVGFVHFIIVRSTRHVIPACGLTIPPGYRFQWSPCLRHRSLPDSKRPDHESF